MNKIAITKTVDGVLVTPREASLAIKYLFKLRKTVKSKDELEIRFDEFIRSLRAHKEVVKFNA